MQRITIIAVGRLKDKFYADASAEYLKRLKGFADVRVVEIPAASLPEDPSPSLIDNALRTEAEAIKKRIPSSAAAVAMCVEGRSFTSEAFAGELSRFAASGREVVFIIGGSYGLADELKRAADIKMSMSEMTFPHRLARIMLLEQIYRGYMISGGRRYHK